MTITDERLEQLSRLEGSSSRDIDEIGSMASELLQRRRVIPGYDRATTTPAKRLMASIGGLVDQIAKQHWLNVHFRAFQLAHDAWQEHIRANASISNNRVVGSMAEEQ